MDERPNDAKHVAEMEGIVNDGRGAVKRNLAFFPTFRRITFSFEV